MKLTEQHLLSNLSTRNTESTVLVKLRLDFVLRNFETFFPCLLPVYLCFPSSSHYPIPTFTHNQTCSEFYTPKCPGHSKSNDAEIPLKHKNLFMLLLKMVAVQSVQARSLICIAPFTGPSHKVLYNQSVLMQRGQI